MKDKIAPYVCIFGKDYCEGNSKRCETCAEWDGATKKCKDIEAIEALFTAETAAMREALQAGADEIWRLRHRSSERPQRTLDVISQMNTALKGGK